MQGLGCHGAACISTEGRFWSGHLTLPVGGRPQKSSLAPDKPFFPHLKNLTALSAANGQAQAAQLCACPPWQLLTYARRCGLPSGTLTPSGQPGFPAWQRAEASAV